MYDSNSKGISYTAGFFILIAFGFTGILFASVLSIPVWFAMTGTGITQMATEMNNPKNADAIRIIQVISVVLGLFIPALATALLLNRRPIRLLGFKKKINLKQAGIVLLIMVTALFVSGALGYLNQWIPIPDTWRIYFDKLETNYNKQVEIMTGLKNFKDYLLAIVIMAFLPALCEETMFRGGLQNFLNRSIKNYWMSILIVSVLFSLVHFSYYGFLPRMFLAIILGLIFYYTGNLWLCILAHFFNNALAITQLYIYVKQGKDIKQLMTDEMPYYWGIIALPLLILLLYRLKKVSPQKFENDKPRLEGFDTENPF
jgi:uncharacterized protein